MSDQHVGKSQPDSYYEQLSLSFRPEARRIAKTCVHHWFNVTNGSGEVSLSEARLTLIAAAAVELGLTLYADPLTRGQGEHSPHLD